MKILIEKTMKSVFYFYFFIFYYYNCNYSEGIKFTRDFKIYFEIHEQSERKISKNAKKSKNLPIIFWVAE